MKRRMKRHAVVQPLDESYRLIPLTQGQNAIVDAGDFEWLSQWNWFAWPNKKTKLIYAKTNRAQRLMHRIILQCTTPEEWGDHKNGDTLDNRRNNLRKVTPSQNAWNCHKPTRSKSGFKGVYGGPHQRWRAQIFIHGKKKNLGRYDSPELAARAYDEAAKHYRDELSTLNFPTSQ